MRAVATQLGQDQRDPFAGDLVEQLAAEHVSTSLPGGTWALGDLIVTRFGYGAMQLAAPAS